MSKPNRDEFISALRRALGTANVLTDPSECLAYSYDNSKRQVQPIAVAFVKTRNDVIKSVELCNQHKIPLTARGKGSGTVGGSIPTENGVIISFEHMNRILEINPANRTMTVEPGVTNAEVQIAAKQHGFFWAPDPSSAAFATVGGNLAYNSAGPRAVKYGTTRENTLGLEAITGEGLLLKTGGHTTKGVVGYDLTRLLIGSEGTLALTTAAILKLTPLPESKHTLRLCYQDIHSACQAIVSLMGQAIIPCALEFMDRAALQLIREHSDVEFPANAQAMLIVEIDGAAQAMPTKIHALQKVANNQGLLEGKAATTEEEIKQLWHARKALSPALRHVAPKKINEDIVVPVANIPKLIEGLESISQHYQIPILNFGHAGNGNLHVNLLYNPDNITQEKNSQPCLQAVFDLVLSLDGTLSGEHGVGLAKKPYLHHELSDYYLTLMQRIKQQFDPNNILNPDK